jgi:CspA family cold shock protein
LIEAIAHDLHYVPGTNRMPAAKPPISNFSDEKTGSICDPSVDAAAKDRSRSLSCSSATRIVRGQSWRREMPTGTVKWFNPTKGYGFIQPSGGGGKDVFVHISAVERAGLRSLNDGQTVEYEIESNRGKESAVNLRVK